MKVPGRGPRPCPAACRTARSRSDPPAQEGRCKATRKREFKPPWREAGSDPPAQRGSEAGSNLRPIDSCITQLEAQGPYRTCNESKEEEAQRERERDWYVIAQKPAPAPHLAHPEGCAALRIVPVTMPRASRSGEHFPDGFDLHLLHSKRDGIHTHTSMTTHRPPAVLFWALKPPAVLPRVTETPYSFT